MISTGLFWLWLALTAIAGFLLGVLVTRWGTKPTWDRAVKAKEIEEKLEQTATELKTYQAQVGDHFVETADLVNKLSQSYKEVYDHLEKGAYTLVGEETLHKRLQNVEAKPIMLEYIGQRRKLPDSEGSKPEIRPKIKPEAPSEKDEGKVMADKALFKD